MKILKPKIKNGLEYLEWCDEQVVKLYYANIAMNDNVNGNVVELIAEKLYCEEGQKLYDDTC